MTIVLTLDPAIARAAKAFKEENQFFKRNSHWLNSQKKKKCLLGRKKK
jgi:hypothetical protein